MRKVSYQSEDHNGESRYLLVQIAPILSVAARVCLHTLLYAMACGGVARPVVLVAFEFQDTSHQYLAVVVASLVEEVPSLEYFETQWCGWVS